jgi:hypothetical protein
LRSLAVTLTRLPRDLKPGLRKSSLPSAEQKGWLFGFSSLASRVLDVVQDKCSSTKFAVASQGPGS